MRTTTTDPLTSTGLIKAAHPIRGEFAEWSTGSDRGGYYPTKGHAINAFDGVLQDYDLCLDPDESPDFSGDNGRKTIVVQDDLDHCVGHAILSWHRMPSGSYEFTGYLA